MYILKPIFAFCIISSYCNIHFIKITISIIRFVIFRHIGAIYGLNTIDQFFLKLLLILFCDKTACFYILINNWFIHLITILYVEKLLSIISSKKLEGLYLATTTLLEYRPHLVLEYWNTFFLYIVRFYRKILKMYLI